MVRSKTRADSYRKIDPKIQRVRRDKVGATREPFRAEGHPATSNQFYQLRNSAQDGSAETAPSVNLSRAQNNDPVMPRRIVVCELLEDVACHWARTKDRQDFQRDYRGIRHAPPKVGQSVFFYCTR